MDNVLGSAYIAIRPEVAGFDAALTRGLAGPLKATESHFSGIGKKAALGLAGIGIAAGAASLEALKMASTFQQQMTLIRTQAGDTTDNLGQLGKQILGLAGQVGQSPEELAKGFYHLASAGFTGRQAFDMLTQGAKLAAVGQSDMETTMQAVIFTMRSGLPDIHNATQAVGMLNAIVGQGDMRMQQLTTSLSSGILPVAAQFGVSLQSLGAALAFMTDRGVPADEATSRLRMSLALLAAPTKVASKYLSDIGVSAKESSYRTNAMTEALHVSGVTTTSLAADLKKPDGIMVALQDLKKHMDAAGVSTEIQNATLSRAFGGGRSGGTIMALYGQLDMLKLKYDQIGKSAGGFAQDWAEQQKTASQHTADFKAAIDALVTTFGQSLLPIGTQVLTFATDVVADLQGTTTATSGTDKAAQGFAKALRDVAGVGKDVMGFLGNLGSWALEHLQVMESLAAVIGGMFVAKKVDDWVKAVRRISGVGSILSTIGGAVGIGGGGKAGAISAAVGTRVFVTNWEMMAGGGKGVPGAGGLPLAIPGEAALFGAIDGSILTIGATAFGALLASSVVLALTKNSTRPDSKIDPLGLAHGGIHNTASGAAGSGGGSGGTPQDPSQYIPVLPHQHTARPISGDPRGAIKPIDVKGYNADYAALDKLAKGTMTQSQTDLLYQHFKDISANSKSVADRLHAEELLLGLLPPATTPIPKSLHDAGKAISHVAGLGDNLNAGLTPAPPAGFTVAANLKDAATRFGILRDFGETAAANLSDLATQAAILRANVISSAAAAAAFGSTLGAGAGSAALSDRPVGNVTVNVHGTNLSPAQIAAQLAWHAKTHS